jgi:uncharacterized protein YrrD
MTGEETSQISWVTLPKGAPVYASDGNEMGKVAEVIADRQKDIFSGVTLRGGLFDHDRFVPAELIERMTPAGVHLRVSSGDAETRFETG